MGLDTSAQRPTRPPLVSRGQRLTAALLRPGTRLMRSLHLPAKLALLAGALLLPLVILMLLIGTTAYHDLDTLARDRDGVRST